MTGIEDAEKLLEIVFKLSSSVPSVIIISNMAQRKDFKTRNGHLDFEQLRKERRLQFIPKPVKPSRLAIIFDPEKSRELSTDQNQTSAQQIALSQKKVFEEMTRRLGNKDIKVLLVEDNRINQMVMLKLLKRVSVAVETCFDGVQATDKVLGKPAGYFSIILVR
jgi:PleD family two-component response regulator